MIKVTAVIMGIEWDADDCPPANVAVELYAEQQTTMGELHEEALEKAQEEARCEIVTYRQVMLSWELYE